MGKDFEKKIHVDVKILYINTILWLVQGLLLFGCSVMSDSLLPHGLQHTPWLPCPSLSPGVFSNPCPLSQWCHPTISSSLTASLLAFILPSIRVFSNKLVLGIRWPKYWSFSFSLSLWFASHIHTWRLEKPELWRDGPLSAKWYLCFLIHCLGLS